METATTGGASPSAAARGGERGARGGETRAIVTGVGAVTPLGASADALITRWVAGECGLVGGLGRCDDFDPAAVLSPRERRRGDRYTHLAVAAGAEAIAGAGWDELPYPADRVGCVIGTGIGGIGTVEAGHATLLEHGADRVSPLLIPNMMPNAAAASIAIRHGLQGEVLGVVSACAAGAHAVGVGLHLLARGTNDAVVVGGSEAALVPLPMAGFATMGATSRCGISRPFDRRRDGFVVGEGAGVLVLESPAAAAARGATALGEVIGYAATSDSIHLTAPSEDGAAAALAMRRALADAGLSASDVDYVNAHGTSTPLNDRSETVAIKAALGERALRVPVSSTKSVIGHTLGAAGAIDAVATLLALRMRVAPPTVGLEQPDDDLDLDYVPGEARPLPGPQERPALVGVSNAFGFGGHNAVLVLRA